MCPINTKHKHFSDGPRRTVVPGTNPTRPRVKRDEMENLLCKPACTGEGVSLSKGQVPVCPRDGVVGPGHRPVQNVLLVFSCPPSGPVNTLESAITAEYHNVCYILLPCSEHAWGNCGISLLKSETVPVLKGKNVAKI